MRLSFPVRTNNVVVKFELVHLDIWGPFVHPSLTGTNYMMTLMDDFSRATWTYLLQHKTQTTSIFSSFITIAQTHIDSKIKCVRTDNGSEFVNLNFSSLLNKHGIIHQRTCPYTPQQNGVVERKHRHLIELARALMFQAALPNYFWPFSFLMATYIVNRLPSVVLNWKTPYELLFRKQLAMLL